MAMTDDPIERPTPEQLARESEECWLAGLWQRPFAEMAEAAEAAGGGAAGRAAAAELFIRRATQHKWTGGDIAAFGASLAKAAAIRQA